MAPGENDVETGKVKVSPSDGRRRMSFVDYVPPPSKPVPPPAKYKLWLLILVCVYFGVWFADKAELRPGIAERLRLSFNGSNLMLLAMIVGVLIYGALDLLLLFVKIKINGQEYGLAAWLKLPRTQWVHQYNHVLVQFIAVVVHIFEEGFALFSATGPPPKKAPNEKPKIYYETESSAPSSDDEKEADDEYHNDDITLRIESHIKPDKVDKYHQWRERFIKRGCHARPGMKSVESSESPDGQTQVTLINFASIDYLNEYMTSPIRARVVRQLQPLLVSPTVVQLQKSRVLPDALTDTCTAQGHPVPKLLPKKWKVWTLTTMGLWFVILVTNETMPFYYDKWGLLDDGVHERAFALAPTIINTFGNVYIMTPFLTMIFGNWLKRQPDEMDKNEPWRTLNDGFKSPWQKTVLTFAFYGGCFIAWVVKSNK